MWQATALGTPAGQQHKCLHARSAVLRSWHRPGQVLGCHRRRCRRPPPLVGSVGAAAAATGGSDEPGTPAPLPADSASAAQHQGRGLLHAWRRWWRLDAEQLLGADQAPPADGSGEAPRPQDMRTILRHVGRLLAPDKGLLGGAIFFMLAAAASELAIPHFVTAAVFAAAKERSESLFRANLACLLAATAAYAGLAAIRGLLFSLVNTNLLQRLRSQLFGRLIRQPVAFFDATETAQLTSRLAADCSVISRLFATSINVALRNALQVIGGAVYLWRLSPQMTATTAAVATALALVAATYGSFTRRAQRIYQDALAHSNSVAEEGFSLSRLVRAFGTEAQTCGRYDATLRTLRHISIRQSVAYSLYVVSNNFLFNATRVATLAVGGAAAVAGHITAEQLTAFMFYTEFIASALLSVCDQWGPIMEAVGASERVLAYLDAPPAPQISAGRVPERAGHQEAAPAPAPAAAAEEEAAAASNHAPPAAAPAAEEAAGSSLGELSPVGGDGRGGGQPGASEALTWQLELRGVDFSYPSRPGSKALDNVSLVIPAGKLTALVGLSGSGKSTLVALAQRLYDPGAGAVLLDGHDLRELDSAWFRRRVGVVSQDPHLFGMSVAENIAYGCPGATREDVERAAAAANAADFIAALPQGYDTRVTDKLLSGGQRQRIAIARALVRDPPLLILDEATSALDAESEAAVQSALDRAMRGAERTVIVIAHRLSTVRHADQTVVMDRGRVAEVGTHAQLMRRGGIYAALVRRQAGTVLDQERDLAPHERQVSSSGDRGGGEGDSGSDAAGGEEAPPPDSLPQWKQQQRLKVEHDPA